LGYESSQIGLSYTAQALRLIQALGDRNLEAGTLNNMGLTYLGLGDDQKALDCLGPARVLYQQMGSAGGEALTLLNISTAYTGLGEHQKALDAAKESARLYQSIGARGQENAALARVARSCGFLGEHQKAVETFEQTLAEMRVSGDRAGEFFTLLLMGEFYSRVGNYQKAQECYDQALQHTTPGKITDERQTTIHYGLAQVEIARGNLMEARAQIEFALSVAEVFRSKVNAQLRASYMASKRDLYEFYVELLMRLHERESPQAHDAKALQASERARARGLLDLLAEARIDVTQGIVPELKQREKTTHAGISRIQSQLIQAHSTATSDKTRIAQLEEELKKVESEREQLEIEIRQQHPQYAELQYPQPLGVKAIQALLDDQTALLEYALGKDRSFLFVVTRDGLHSYSLPRATEITRLVRELRAAVSRPRRREFGEYVQLARQLYHKLVAPAADVLTKKQRLLIVPDGALYYLPFESLLTHDARPGGRTNYGQFPYLLKRWAVSYAPSASVLASLRGHDRQEKNDERGKAFLAFADPVYELSQATDPRPQTPDQKTKSKQQRTTGHGPQNPVIETLRSVFEESGRWQLPRLMESHREVKRIEGLYKPNEVEVYVGTAAKEENVKSNEHLSRARRIHFATHGMISERQPQYSGLVLALDDDPQEDGLLQVYEVFNLKLTADLVVLSACKTGLGKEVKGEGLIGLTRAFLYAGARSVVVSLSQVVDASTAELMARFYEEMDRIQEKAEALRRAKLGLIEGGRYAHPYYWSPFILVGEAK
jgi:CHAT domain-containing protein